MNPSRRVRFLAAPLLAAGACGILPSQETGAGAALAGTGLASTDLVTGDPVLARAVAIRDLAEAEGGGLRTVAFELVNRSGRELLFEYRFQWTDAEGLEIEDSGRVWTPIVLAAAGSVPMRTSAPRPGAGRWTLEVRPPPDSR
ncbi:MAG TPA: DUF1425 domain-containing protein [Planctomycetota bacterium]|nr:DUF1425 domain-containing protein [Planctomycetota bacterium]